jgi:hypothetical protein
MRERDLIMEVEQLLDRPLLSYHPVELKKLLEKARSDKLTASDRKYIVDMWKKFRSLSPARPRESGIADVGPAAEDPLPVSDQAELVEAQKTIAILRERGKRAVAQRDKWEARAKQLEKELADTRKQNVKTDWKFAEAKRAFAKLYHPNSSKVTSPLEALIRGEIFKEFRAELDRIDAQILDKLQR